MAKAIFKLNPVYPARPELEQFSSDLEVLESAEMALVMGEDGKIALIQIPPSLDPNSDLLSWDSITGKPELFDTQWNQIRLKPPAGIPAGGSIIFYGNDEIVLTGVFATDSDLIMTLDGGNSSNPFWRVCDGTNGTPDLRGRFVVGAGQGAGLTDRMFGATGGEESHALTVAEIPTFPPAIGAGGNPGYSGPPFGTGAAHNTMPPFYVGYPIIRTSRRI